MNNDLVENKLDIVTVGFSPELNLLKLQARSIAKYFSHDAIGSIQIIINEKNPKFFKTYFHEHVLAEYGVLKDKVHLYHYCELTGKKLKKIGWRSQQILKLVAHSIVGTENYLVLDCKNHFIRPVNFQNFVADDGRLISHQYKITDYFWRQYELACTFFGLPSAPKHEYALPTVTPFLMKTQIAADLVVDVSTKAQMHFADAFMKEGFTEFYLYYAYLLKRFSTIDTVYKRSERSSVSLLASKARNVEKVKELIEKIEKNMANCFGVHRSVASENNNTIRIMIEDVWLKFDLIKTRDDAVCIWDAPKDKSWKRFWIF